MAKRMIRKGLVPGAGAYGSDWSGATTSRPIGVSPGYWARQGQQLRGAARGATQGAAAAPGGGIASAYQKAMDEYRQDVEGRYGDIKGRYEARRKRALGYLEGVGTRQRADLAQQYAQERGRTGQWLRGRGLAGTSLSRTLRTGSLGKEAEASQRLEEGLKRERLGYDVGLERDTLGFMERREDVPPDYQQMMALAQMQGQTGGRGAGYGVGGGLGPTSLGMHSPRAYMPGVGDTGLGRIVSTPALSRRRVRKPMRGNAYPTSAAGPRKRQAENYQASANAFPYALGARRRQMA